MGRKCINCGGDIVVGKVLHEIEDDVFDVEIKTECVYCEVLTRTKVEKRELLDKLKQKRRRLIYLEERLNLRKLKNQIERYPNNFEDF
jgi:hypothetical protein